MEMAVSVIRAWIEQRTPSYICVTPVHGIMECQHSEELRTVYNNASLVTPDGMPVVWVCRMRGYKHVSRVYGPDLMLELSERFISDDCRHYYLGGAEGVAEKLTAVLTERFPGLNVVGAYSPPYRQLTLEEEAAMLQRINDAKPDIVWVGLGAPKQERWMAHFRDRLEAPILIGVGAAFDFHAGTKPQAPKWMQKNGLEWLFRLSNEPGRLWKRYLVYNTLFVYNLFLQSTGLRKFPLD